MKLVFTATILFLNFFALGQAKQKPSVHDLRIPSKLSECFILLDKTMPDEEITLIKTLQEDSIHSNSAFRYGTDFFHAWKLYDGSKLTKYFNKLGLYGSDEIYETILISYHRYLNKESIKLEEKIAGYQEKQKKDHEKYLAAIQKDSINGVYIPKDLKDCFTELDKMLPETNKQKIKNLKDREETILYHLSLGMTLRNTWQLWGGSRLQKYFLDRKINHPDKMSSLILEFYYDWLNNKNSAWQKWMQ